MPIPAGLLLIAARIVFSGILLHPIVALTAADNPAPEPLIASLTLNGVARGDNALLMTRDRDFWILRTDYEVMGIKVVAETLRLLNGLEYISLNALAALAGNRIRFDDKNLALDVNLPVELFSEKTVSLQDASGGPQRLAHGNGAFANYFATVSHNQGTDKPIALRLSTELGAYIGPAFVRQENVYASDGGATRFSRVATQIVFDHLPSMSRVTLLDTTGTSGELGSTVPIGGLSWASYYPMSPKLLRSPLASITGTVETPSMVDVTLGGLPITRQRVMPGAFEIRNIAYYGGARTLEVTVTDASGRVRRFNMPYYFSDLSLREGLHDFNYSVGKVRRDTGNGGPSYDNAAMLGYHLYGMTDWLTLGVRGEATADIANGGAGATLRHETLGVFSSDFALSKDKHSIRSGHAIRFAYTYQGSSGGLRIAGRQLSFGYRTVSSPDISSPDNFSADPGLLPVVRECRINAYFNPTSSLFLSGDWGHVRDAGGKNGQSMGVNVTYRFNSAVSLTGGVRRFADPGHLSITDGFLGLFWSLDPISTASISSRHAATTSSTNISYNRVAPVGEGLGYRLEADREENGNSRLLRLTPHVQYNLPWGIVSGDGTFENDSTGGQRNGVSVSLAGGLTLIGSRLSTTRPIYDSFGLVDLGVPIKGVRVYLNNQLIGNTDTEGHLYIPSLSSFQDNLIRLEHRDIPLEFAVDRIDVTVAPAFRAGIVIPFQLYRARALSGRIVSLENGLPVPAPRQRIVVVTANGRKNISVESGGDFYVEGIAPGRYRLNAHVASRTCTVNLSVPDTPEIYVELKEALVCE